jgi:hypothetical protein
VKPSLYVVVLGVFFLIASFGAWFKKRAPDRREGLSAIQRAAIREVLVKYGRPVDCGQDDQYRYFIIFPIPGIPEASTLAAQFRAVFGECGLDTQLVSNELPGLRDTSRFNHGIWLRGTGDADQGYYQPPTITVLREALERAAIPYQYTPDDVGDVELIIGAPPHTPSDTVVAELSTAAYHRDVTKLTETIAELRLATARRHLNQEQKDTIDRISVARVKTAIESWSPGEDHFLRFCITLCVIGSDTETSDYRHDFEEAFGRAFAVRLENWQAAPYLSEFRNAVSVLDPTDRRNIVHPWILEALRAANVPNLREQANDFQRSPMVQHFEVKMPPPWSVSDSAVWIVIGAGS